MDRLLLSVPQSLTLPTKVEQVILSGSGDNAVIQGNAGNNTFVVQSGSWTLDGSGGTDTVVFSHKLSDYTLSQTSSALTVTGTDGTVSLTHVEKITFADAQVIFDTSATAKLVFSLYQAALGRASDPLGQAYWEGKMTSGATLQNLASSFVSSAEFKAKFGANSAAADYVNALYSNVLHRNADTAGQDYWVHQMANTSRETMLINFASSAENQVTVTSIVGQGVLVGHAL